jgi:hypothetical protein
MSPTHPAIAEMPIAAATAAVKIERKLVAPTLVGDELRRLFRAPCIGPQNALASREVAKHMAYIVVVVFDAGVIIGVRGHLLEPVCLGVLD